MVFYHLIMQMIPGTYPGASHEPDHVPLFHLRTFPGVNECQMCYSISEIELILGISRPSVLKLLNKNEFKWFKIGTVYRISKPSFEEWMQKTL